MQNRIETLLATTFGVMFLGLSLFITVEVLLRKLFGISLDGSYELGGYALAIGSTLSFTLALFGRSHIRIDIIHERLPAIAKAVLNTLSAILLASFAALMGYLAWSVIADTLDYHAVSQTPWATPLIYPQSLWYAGQAIFMIAAIYLALKACWLLSKGLTSELNEMYQPKSIKQELEEELDSLKVRTATPNTTLQEHN